MDSHDEECIEPRFAQATSLDPDSNRMALERPLDVGMGGVAAEGARRIDPGFAVAGRAGRA